MHTKDVFYIALNHEREFSDDILEEIIENPENMVAIGPVGISFAWGGVRLHTIDEQRDNEWGAPEYLTVTEHDELIEFKGRYFSDFEVLSSNSPILQGKLVYPLSDFLP